MTPLPGAIHFGLIHLLLLPFLFGFALLATAFWIWMLVDCAKRIGAGDTRLIGWLLVIALAHGLGALLYFIFGRDNRPRLQP